MDQKLYHSIFVYQKDPSGKPQLSNQFIYQRDNDPKKHSFGDSVETISFMKKGTCGTN